MHSMMKDEHLLMERASCVCENRRMFVSVSTDRPEQSVSVFLHSDLDLDSGCESDFLF